MNITLLVMLALIVILAIVGKVKGLVRVIYGLGTSIAILVLTLILNPLVRDFARNNETIFNSVYETVDGMIDIPIENIGDCKGYIHDLGLPEKLEVMAYGLTDELTEEMEHSAAGLEEFLKGKVTELVITAGAFVFTAILVFAGVHLAFWALDLISKLPVIHTANSFLGLVFGLAEGILLVTLILALVPLFATTAVGTYVIGDIHNSSLLTFIYEHNILSSLVSWITGW